MLGKISCSVCDYNGCAGLDISVGDFFNLQKTVNPNTMTQGNNTVDFLFCEGASLKIKLIGKNHDIDTMVDNHGTIIKDKHIFINSITLKHITLTSDSLYHLGFNPYLGMNEKQESLWIPPVQEWPYWYLDIIEKTQSK